MSTSIDSMLEGLARKLADRDTVFEDDVVYFERRLRESKLPELIAAGQKMHQHAWGDHAEFAAAHKTFGLALAAYLAATDSVPPSKL